MVNQAVMKLAKSGEQLHSIGTLQHLTNPSESLVKQQMELTKRRTLKNSPRDFTTQIAHIMKRPLEMDSECHSNKSSDQAIYNEELR